MRWTRFVLLALAVALITALAGAANAAAATRVIDAADTGPEGHRWVPPTVTIDPGDKVEWQFDQATLPHNVKSTSANWSIDSEIGTAQGPAEYTFTTPGTYTFLCEVHPVNMTGSVTVTDPDAPAGSLDKVLVVSKTAGFRHDSIPQGIAAIQQLGTQNDFTVDSVDGAMTAGTSDPQLAAAFTDANLAQYDVVVFLSTTSDILTAPMQDAFERYIQAGGGYAGIHAASDTEYTWPWYGEMLGGYFRNHPAGTPTATVNIEDGNEPSTDGIATPWSRVDEWYNFQRPTNPVVNGNQPGIPDYSPRDSDVHVLATVDESTYGEDDDSEAADDHPVAWCSNFDGGRVWYTAMGHTQASFSEAPFLKHLLGGLRTAAGAPADCGEPREATPTGSDFEVISLDDDTQSPMELDIAPDGRVFYIERKNTGAGADLRVIRQNGEVALAGEIPVDDAQENGLIGLQLDPNFATNHWLYVAYTPLPTSSSETRISRFTVVGDTIDMASERVIFTWPAQRQQCCHSSGSIAFDSQGNLYVSTGDNTNPFDSNGFDPIDERPGREFWDAQRTSANSNSLSGKVLRIKPLPDPIGAPGVGTTYTIPSGNMFPEAQDTNNKTRPEIFAMGFRNPFRITIDPYTDQVLLGDYGPDSGVTDPNRGPQGSVEYNVVTPGFYGWPYCVRTNVPYNDYNFATGTSGPKFNCAAPKNESPNNTGLVDLPPAKPATMWMGYSETDPRFPALGGGGAPTGGPRYKFDPDLDSTTKFPAFYDKQWFIGEWNNGWIKTATLDDATNQATGVFTTPWQSTFKRPHELEFGPDGSLYVIDWGTGFNGDNTDSGIYRIDYNNGLRKPVAHATATPDNGPAPLAVQFSSAGSADPDGTSITYDWDFGDGSAHSSDANPSHTYAQPGSYTVRLVVTDQAGQTGIDNLTVVAGNTRPHVELQIPADGKFASFGETVPYKIVVTDAEDTNIDCSKVKLSVQLGHDDHAHPLFDKQGCEGTFETASDGGHGANANIFQSIVASYTDNGATGSAVLTGIDDAILHPKRKRAEYFDGTGRIAGSTATGDPGVTRENTSDTGNGQSAAFIEHGDWISFERMNFTDLTAVRTRVASGGAGGTIEFRVGAPDGPVIATQQVVPTGDWQTWTTLETPLTNVPDETFELFIVFKNPASNDGLMNLNWFEVRGKGAAVSQAPDVSATATPGTGTAPLTVAFDGTATDPDAATGEQLTYKWDFGVSGTTADTSTEEDPDYTYDRPGTYTATFTATDPQGAKSSATVTVRVTASGQCPTGPVRSDEFEGTALDTNRWEVIRPDAEHPLSVADGHLTLPIAPGSIYQAGTTAKNIVVQPMPDGEFSATAKITTEPLTENYQQAGLRVYAGDDNWASVHMISAGGQRDIEFIAETNGNPRNGAADKLGGIPATAPTTYWVRLTSDGQSLRASYSFDGDTFLPVGQPASLATFNDAKIGPAALSDSAPSVPNAQFDWIRFDPDNTGGGDTGGIVDEFDGTALGGAWNVVRQDQTLSVSGSALHVPAAAGDLYGTGANTNNAKNIVLRPAPDGAWTATTKIAFEGVTQYHQAGLLVYGDDDNFTKFGRLSTNAAGNGDEKFEFIYENAGSPRNDGADSTTNLPATFPKDYFMRVHSDGTNLTGAYSIDGENWTTVGRPAPLPANARIGMFAFSNAATTAPVADFDWFKLEGDTVGGGGGGTPAGPSYDDQFEGTTLDKARWNAIVRDTPAGYAVADGKLAITTSPGDIYTSPNTNPTNFILQSADHAGDDWVIETKIDGATINGGYGQGGLLAYVDDDNYVKFDAISDDGQTRINRLELRSEIAGAIQQPQPADPPIAAGVTEIWLRLTKTGQSYAGAYSLDGETWTPVAAPVTSPMQAPAFGLFGIGPNPAGQGDLVPFEYFTLNGEDPATCGDCTSTGDEFDGASLDKTKFNAIAHDDASKYALAGGGLQVTTTAGEIYQGSTGGGPLLLQSADHAGADWVIETKLSHTLDGGYSQGGMMAYGSDNDYVKIDAISDQDNATVNRLELRSETGGTIGATGTDPLVPAGTANIWLRLTKAGSTYTGEYSFDGTTWSAFGYTVTNAMASPSFGLYTQGVQQAGDTVTFDYFAIDGKRGCPGEEPENKAPVVGDVTASPTIGLAPLPVDFTSDATDPDGDALSYSWDFGDGSAAATTKNATHTYQQAGTYNAKVTVSDGEKSASKTVTVQVLPADDAQARFRVLVFSKTTGFRHDSIPAGITAIKELGTANGFQVDATEDASVFRAGLLAKYDTVVFLSTTGDPLNAAQQDAFEAYIKGGGGFTGIHAAADTEYDWNWYGKLVGAYFRNHPAGTPDATVLIEDADHPSTTGITSPWPRTDEWYNYRSPEAGAPDTDYSPRAGGVHVLALVDESTYGEDDGNATDDDHPISWCQRYDGGRSWYTGMGHTQASFSEAAFRKHLLGGLEVSAGAVEDADCGETGAQSDIQLQAFADPSSGPAPLTTNLSATALDPDGDTLTYKWTFSDGGSAFGSSINRTYATKGTYTATVTASDGKGETASKELTITVGESAPPVFRAASATPTSGAAPLDVVFEAVADDPDGGKVTYRWEFGDGGSALGNEADHTYLEPGTFTAKVIATDPTGSSATKEFTITVAPAPGNGAPTVSAAADPGSGNAPLAVSFTAQGTDPDGDELTYAWDFGDGSSGAGRRARHTYTANGTYTATVTADDGNGGTATGTVQVVVGNPAGNQPPTVEIAADRITGTAPLKVNFSAAGHDPEGAQVLLTWDYGDGHQAAGTNPSHTFAQAGTYTVTVTATDPGGKSGTAQVTITVTAKQSIAGQPSAGKGALRTLSVPSLSTFRKRGLKVAATCAGTGKAAVGLWASKAAAKRLGLKGRGLGRARFQCTAGKTLQLTLKPGKKVRKAIKAAKLKRLKLTVALALEDGAAVTRKLTLKR